MKARRSTRLLATPLIVAVLVWAIFFAAPNVVVMVGLFGFVWLMVAVADVFKVLTITDQAITLRGVIGGPLTIERKDAVRCRYMRYRGDTRAGEYAFFEILGYDVTHIKVSRFGWGRDRKRVFVALNEWLRSSPAEVLPDVQRRLDRLSR